MHASVAGLLSEKQAFLTSKVKQPIFNGTSFVSYRTIDNSGVYSHVEFGRTCSQDSTDCTCFMQKNQYLEKCFYHNVPEVSQYFFETIGKMKEHDYLIF